MRAREWRIHQMFPIDTNAFFGGGGRDMVWRCGELINRWYWAPTLVLETAIYYLPSIQCAYCTVTIFGPFDTTSLILIFFCERWLCCSSSCDTDDGGDDDAGCRWIGKNLFWNTDSRLLHWTVTTRYNIFTVLWCIYHTWPKGYPVADMFHLTLQNKFLYGSIFVTTGTEIPSTLRVPGGQYIIK